MDQSSKIRARRIEELLARSLRISGDRETLERWWQSGDLPTASDTQPTSCNPSSLEVATSELGKYVDESMAQLDRNVAELLTSNQEIFKGGLARFIDSIEFSSPLTDSIPFVKARIDDEGLFFWDYRTLDEQLSVTLGALIELLQSGEYLTAFRQTADALCGLYGAYEQCDRALLTEIKKYEDALALEREQKWPSVLGPIARKIAGFSRADAGAVNGGATLQKQLEELTQQDRQIRDLHTRLTDNPRPTAHRTMLGSELVRLFAYVGFNQRRGPYTKDAAAHFAISIAARFLIPLKINSVRVAKPRLSRDV